MRPILLEEGGLRNCQLAHIRMRGKRARERQAARFRRRQRNRPHAPALTHALSFYLGRCDPRQTRARPPPKTRPIRASAHASNCGLTCLSGAFAPLAIISFGWVMWYYPLLLWFGRPVPDYLDFLILKHVLILTLMPVHRPYACFLFILR